MSMCVVRVVLLCKGRGADASSYRPHRDESQWWNRRDALVRCAAAFLHGPAAAAAAAATWRRELVFLHDEDYARMEMTLDSNVLPTEQAILALWREAASNPDRRSGSTTMAEGVTCRMVLDSKAPSLPSSMESKRQVLEHLQKQCSMEFLRKHGLNSSANVILRKTNKQALMGIWNQWNEANGPNTSSRSNGREDLLASIFQDLLRPMSSSIEKVVAGVLHESSNSELPCFDIHHDKEDAQLQVCLFLGAVRDMHPWENRVLSSCCSAAHVPLVHVRLGPVPEFTSKILTVVAHHDAQGNLGPALLRLVQQQQQQHDKKSIHGATWESTQAGTQRLHVLCSLPIPSDELASDLSKRSRALWALVRVTVCTLWRSRLASNMDHSTTPLHNVLTIMFQDGIAMTLEQEELVTSLAEQHQAAPSEHQILEALCRKRDEILSTSGEWSEEKAEQVVECAVGANQSSLPTYALDMRNATTASTSNYGLLLTLYSLKEGAVNSHGQLLALLRIRQGESRENGVADSLVIKACKRRGIPVIRESMVALAAQDEEAATVTLLQHFIYQKRLFPALECIATSKQDARGDKKRSRRKEKSIAQSKKKAKTLF